MTKKWNARDCDLTSFEAKCKAQFRRRIDEVKRSECQDRRPFLIGAYLRWRLDNRNCCSTSDALLFPVDALAATGAAMYRGVLGIAHVFGTEANSRKRHPFQPIAIMSEVAREVKAKEQQQAGKKSKMGGPSLK